MKLTKLNIMKTRPEISDDEIHAMMDFDKVLQQHNSEKKLKTTSAIVASCMVIALVATWWYFRPVEEVAPAVVPEVQQQEQPIAPEQKKDLEQQEVKSLKPVEIKKKPIETADVFTEAEPVVGYDNLYSYFEKELTYPADLKEKVSGEVDVTFIINRDGKPEQIKFLNSLGPEFDTEVTRVVTNMPAWKPATQNGKPVPTKISQTFTFSLDK